MVRLQPIVNVTVYCTFNMKRAKNPLSGTAKLSGGWGDTCSLTDNT